MNYGLFLTRSLVIAAVLLTMLNSHLTSQKIDEGLEDAFLRIFTKMQGQGGGPGDGSGGGGGGGGEL